VVRLLLETTTSAGTDQAQQRELGNVQPLKMELPISTLGDYMSNSIILLGSRSI